MPCRDPFFPEPNPWGDPNHSLSVASPEVPETPPTVEFLRNLHLYGFSVADGELPGILMEVACSAFTELDRLLALMEEEGYTYTSYVPARYQQWWREHYLRDEKRLEEVRKKALAKLTDEEKKALGLP